MDGLGLYIRIIVWALLECSPCMGSMSFWITRNMGVSNN